MIRHVSVYWLPGVLVSVSNYMTSHVVLITEKSTQKHTVNRYIQKRLPHTVNLEVTNNVATSGWGFERWMIIALKPPHLIFPYREHRLCALILTASWV
jgi:hypothetical protein